MVALRTGTGFVRSLLGWRRMDHAFLLFECKDEEDLDVGHYARNPVVRRARGRAECQEKGENGPNEREVHGGLPEATKQRLQMGLNDR